MQKIKEKISFAKGCRHPHAWNMSNRASTVRIFLTKNTRRAKEN
jgi:hypothetical protein